MSDMTVSEKVALAVATVMAAVVAESKGRRGEFVKIATGHLGTALDLYRDSVVKAVADELDHRKAERTL